MNKITLQNLTPEVYYNQSRDFQFLGRLFDIVLNSVKTNADELYELPISYNSNERLIDLMTMTLGFRSQHNYNVKQLTALCSAFAIIIKNKGNQLAILDAVRALLNAEGITDEPGFSISDDKQTINLFIPQTLRDTNLLKDLLNYILPAGMSCNISKEFIITAKDATTTLTTTDVLTSHYTKTSGEDSTAVIANEEMLAATEVSNKPGFFMNTDVYKPEEN